MPYLSCRFCNKAVGGKLALEPSSVRLLALCHQGLGIRNALTACKVAREGLMLGSEVVIHAKRCRMRVFVIGASCAAGRSGWNVPGIVRLLGSTAADWASTTIHSRCNWQTYQSHRSTCTRQPKPPQRIGPCHLDMQKVSLELGRLYRI